MRELAINTAMIAYLLMSVFTYGHAQNHLCKQAHPERLWECAFTSAILTSPIVAAVWPLYWSAHFQRANHG